METPKRSRSPPGKPKKHPSTPRLHRSRPRKHSPRSAERVAQEQVASPERKLRSKAHTTEQWGGSLSKQPESITVEQGTPTVPASAPAWSNSTGLTAAEQPATSSGPPASTEVNSIGLCGGSSTALSSTSPKPTASSSQHATASQPSQGQPSSPRVGLRNVGDGLHSPSRPTVAQIAGPIPRIDRDRKLARGTSRPKLQSEYAPVPVVPVAKPSAVETDIGLATSQQRPPGMGSWTKVASPGHGTESTLPSTRSCRSAAVMALAVLATTVIVCCLAYALLSRPRKTPYARDQLLCRTKDCRIQAEILNTWLNSSIDPCYDFEAHVCSKWINHEKNKRDGAHSIMDLALKQWVSDFEKNLVRAVPHHPVASQLLGVFTSCMADASPSESLLDMARMKAFMGELRVPWPEAPLEGTDPLEVAIDLSVNWSVGPWLDVTLLRLADGTTNVVLRPASLCRVWFQVEREVAASGAHRALWNGLYGAFSPGQQPRPDSEIDSILQTHSDIFKELSQVVMQKPKEPLRFPLREISANLPNVSAARWKKAVEASTGYLFDFTDAVTFADKTLLDAMRNIFSRHNDTAMLRDLSWTIAQVFSSVADRNFLTYTLGNRYLALQQRRKLCATEVEAAYRWLIVSLRVITDFPLESRETIDASLKDVTLAVLSKLENLSWAEPGFRRALTDKVANVSVILWPSGSALTPEGLSDFYAGWISNSSSFTQHWITAMRNWRHLSVSEHPDNFLLPFISYDYFLNAVRMALVTLQPPLHYANGTKAMMYGSLGFYYALHLVRSFDGIGLKIDAEGRVSDSWLPAQNATLANRASCLGSGQGYDDFFPEIPAMEAAHAAFEAALNDPDRPQTVVRDFSEDQLFFFAACITVCGLQHERTTAQRIDCNKAITNFPPFAKAFGCRANVAMNPSDKCPFFD